MPDSDRAGLAQPVQLNRDLLIIYKEVLQWPYVYFPDNTGAGMSDDLKVKKINSIPYKIPPYIGIDPQKQKKQPENSSQQARYHFEQLAEAAEESHNILVKEKSPYRFCVYRKEDEVFIDVVILDENGKIKEIKKSNITEDEFTTWLTHIHGGRGLLIDETP